jgi:hypothetical protein
MKTEYYCKVCDERWMEYSVPNMHRMHTCGAVARIIRSAAYGGQGT